MTLTLLAAAAAGRTGVPWPRRAAALVSAGVATMAAWWAAGLFSVAGAESLATEGLGHYSMNLLSPISPTGGWSRMLPEWPRATSGQDYEGFQYLGLGGLGLLIAAAVLALRPPLRVASGDAAPHDLPRWGRLLPLLVAALAMAMYALSPRVTVGSVVLFDLTGPITERLAVFRATGRFFWPLGYLLLTLAIAAVVTRARPSRAVLIL